MSKLRTFVSGTIVLFLTCTVWASPQGVVPDAKEPESTWPTQPPDENLSVAEPPEVTNNPPPKDPRYYSYRQALTFRAGMGSDFPKLALNDSVFGFSYLFPKFLSPKLEAGADLHEEGRGHIFVGWRQYIWERSYFRPSGKISIDHNIDSEENLATFTEVDNYYLRASGTLEYVVWNPYSVRFENEFLFNFNRVIYVVTLGISRGW